MESEKWLNISELKQTTQIPPATVERYLRDFRAYLHFEETGRGKYYPPGTAAVLLRIYELSKQHRKSRDEIESIIRAEFDLSITVDVDGDGASDGSIISKAHPSSLVTRDDVALMMEMVRRDIVDEIKATRDENRQLHEALEAHRQEATLQNEELKQKLEEQQQCIEDTIKRRDEALMEYIHQQREAAAAREQKKGFFGRLFGR